MKDTLGYLLIFGLSVGLTGCGGGGESKSPPNEIPSSVSSSSVATTSSLSSSLSSAASSPLSSSGNSSSASSVVSTKTTVLISGNVFLKDSNDSDLSLDSAESVTVSLSLLNAKGDVLATSSPKLIDTLSATPEKGVPFTAEITANDAKTIVVIVSKPGFSDFARRVEFSSNVDLTVTLKKLQELTINSTEVTSISGKTLEGYNVSVNNSDGNEEIVNGSTGGIADLSVSIPQSALPVGTSSVDVSMQAFNPNNPTEAQSFPGAYQDSTGNKLLSVAFNYTDVKTDAGVSLKKIAQKTRDSRLLAQKQSGQAISPMQFAKQNSQKTGVASEPVIINRKIPTDSCLSLSQLGDANATQAGFQVPVYTYNTTNGLWDLLGYGTLFDENGVLIAADQKVFDCSQHTYVLEIEATNEIFLSNWWNLDYPLIFTQPIKLCADLELHNDSNKPVIGSTLYLTDDDDSRSFSAESFVSDANGRVHIEAISLDGGTDLTATAYTFNSSFYSGYTEVPVKLSTTCNMSAPPVVVNLIIPEMCKVDGRVVNASGLPLAKHYVIGADFTAGTAMPGFASTDADGHYQLSLECKKKYQVIDAYSYAFGDQSVATDFSVNVNGTVDLSEVSDNSSAAVMKDLIFTSKPIAYVYPTSDSLTQVSLYVLYVGTDFPLTYNFSIKDKNAVVLGQYSGTVTAANFNLEDEFGSGYAEVKIDHHLTDAQIQDPTGYTAVGEIKDSKGVTTQINSIYQGGEN